MCIRMNIFSKLMSSWHMNYLKKKVKYTLVWYWYEKKRKGKEGTVSSTSVFCLGHRGALLSSLHICFVFEI